MEKVKPWWSEDGKWFCLLVDDGVNNATVSLTPDEARALGDAIPIRAATVPTEAEATKAILKAWHEGKGFEQYGEAIAHDAARAVLALLNRKSPANDEVERLRERCDGYKGQVEAGSIAIQHLQGEIDRLRASPDCALRAALTEIRDNPEMTGCEAMAIATRALSSG